MRAARRASEGQKGSWSLGLFVLRRFGLEHRSTQLLSLLTEVVLQKNHEAIVRFNEERDVTASKHSFGLVLLLLRL